MSDESMKDNAESGEGSVPASPTSDPLPTEASPSSGIANTERTPSVVPGEQNESRTANSKSKAKDAEPQTADSASSSSEVLDATSTHPSLAQDKTDDDVLAESRRHTRRSFVLAALAAAAGYETWKWTQSTTHSEEMLTLAQRRAVLLNEKVAKTVLPEYPIAPTYPLNKAENLRINGIYGLKRDLDLSSWRLQVVGMRDAHRHAGYVQDVTAWKYRYMAADSHDDKGHDTKVDPSKERHSEGDGTTTAIKMAPAEMLEKAIDDERRGEDENGTGRGPRGLEEAGESDSTLSANTPGVLLQLSDITSLPRHELVTQFKCIEGWSQIVHWAGVRMADFIDAFPPALIDGKEPRYAYMETPDGDYYVGYDLYALRHPQALLVTEMMGQPLTQKHGAPLRLHTPTKYGYKQIKRIGLIAYSNERPDDYWTKLGYDWFGGL